MHDVVGIHDFVYVYAFINSYAEILRAVGIFIVVMHDVRDLISSYSGISEFISALRTSEPGTSPEHGPLFGTTKTPWDASRRWGHQLPRGLLGAVAGRYCLQGLRPPRGRLFFVCCMRPSKWALATGGDFSGGTAVHSWPGFMTAHECAQLSSGLRGLEGRP